MVCNIRDRTYVADVMLSFSFQDARDFLDSLKQKAN